MKTTMKRQISILLVAFVVLSLLPSVGWASDSSIMTGESNKIAAGNSIMAVKDDGTLWQWGGLGLSSYGKSVPTQIMKVTNVKTIDGDFTKVLLKDDGTVWVWGNNSFGQLGNGTYTPHPQYGYQAFDTDIPAPTQVNGLTGVIDIGAGSDNIIVLKADGTVWAWGNNDLGQLGDGTFIERHTPVQVKGLTGVKAISVGGSITVAVKNDGTVWAWGDFNGGGTSNWWGEMDISGNTIREGYVDLYSTPVQIKGLTNIVAVSAESGHQVALKSDGTVWTWGYYLTGLQGDGGDYSKNHGATFTPVKAKIDDVVSIAAGSNATLALKKDGTVWAWGSNFAGYSDFSDLNNLKIITQLGVGSSASRITTPTQVQVLSDIVEIAAGETFFAIKEDGSLWAWGYNGQGQYGNNQSERSDIPVQTLINLKAPTIGFSNPQQGSVQAQPNNSSTT